MNKKHITFNVGKETIAGIILENENSSHVPQCVSFHGAGASVKETLLNVIAEPMSDQALNILTIDFSGHGSSTGILTQGSLKKRVLEAQAAINGYASTQKLVVCGSSMGGYIAIKMLESYPVDTLILFCPALHDGNAYDVQFDQGFTDIIRKHESWRNTDVTKVLEAFAGNLLIVMGEKDTVIPAGVIEIIDRCTPNTRKKEIYTIPECPHKIDLWLLDHPEALKKLQHKILGFITYKTSENLVLEKENQYV